MGQTFYILDVFAQSKYSGNQLAVFPDAHSFSTDQMQQLAKEMNYSETTFITSSDKSDGGFDVRIFTPDQEVPFAGHPTLGTAALINQLFYNNQQEEIQLNLQIGTVSVKLVLDEKGSIKATLKAPEPQFHETIQPKAAAAIIGCLKEDIDKRFPVQVVSAGIPFIMIPLKKRSSVEQARENMIAYQKIAHQTDARLVFLFCPEPVDDRHHLHARMFASQYGITEDPATGSANVCLAAYLLKYRYFGENLSCIVEQGYEMKRPSLLYLDGHVKAGQFVISVGGSVFLVAKGELI